MLPKLLLRLNSSEYRAKSGFVNPIVRNDRKSKFSFLPFLFGMLLYGK